MALSLHFICSSALALCALLLPETPRQVLGQEFAAGHAVNQKTKTLLYLLHIRFLVRKHKDSKALKVLNKIHPDNDKAESELIEIQSSMRHSTHESFQQKLKYMLSKSVLLRFVCVCVCVCETQWFIVIAGYS